MTKTINFATFFILDRTDILAGPFGNEGRAARKLGTYKKKYYPHLTIAKKMNTMEIPVNGDGTRR